MQPYFGVPHLIKCNKRIYGKVEYILGVLSMGQLKISASVSSLESALASALQDIYFCFQNFFWKNGICMFFLVLSYGISTTLLQILISLRFPIHPSKGAHWCSGKSLFELSEASFHFIGVLKKWLLWKILHTSQQNIQGGVLFKYIHRPSWDFSKFRGCNLKACNLL